MKHVCFELHEAFLIGENGPSGFRDKLGTLRQRKDGVLAVFDEIVLPCIEILKRRMVLF